MEIKLTIKWLDVAKTFLGTKEVPGKKSNPKIMQWAANLGGWIKSFYKDDSIPWCGLFVANCMNAAGYKPVAAALSALAWNEFGIPTQPRLGAVMVFKRTGGGHVGFYVSEDDTTYHILGGNQSDAVTITRVEKKRFVGARWPRGVPYPPEAVPIKKKFDGKISYNEA